MYEATRSLAARSSCVKDSRVTPPPSCFPIPARSESLRHSRSPSITFFSPPCPPILARAEGAGIVEGAEQEIGGQPVRRDAVAAGQGTGHEQRVQNCLLGRLRRGIEERRHALVRDHGEGYGHG